MIYIVVLVLLVLIVGFNNLKMFLWWYLLWGSFLFVLYELCFLLLIGYVNSGWQVIEVGMVNYLWLMFMMLLVIVFNKQWVNVLIVLGVLMFIFGICFVFGGD